MRIVPVAVSRSPSMETVPLPAATVSTNSKLLIHLKIGISVDRDEDIGRRLTAGECRLPTGQDTAQKVTGVRGNGQAGNLHLPIQRGGQAYCRRPGSP